ncbi:hypothetical protein BT93_L1223 [Corymbia citriodora subsp. variegata]|uniref:hydroxymethylbilane synthase n=1 Tax=Corymbia citriodora subsp. variegata TaxID=360336 RepID=A0A8T0CIL4_CORYI|nr:hypothetical protein BT93_L1223 [Corymbia citriodora subsp. variegata]
MLIAGTLSLLVHSLKDVPTVMPDGCEIGANTKRADPRDAFVVRADSKYTRIQDLPAGSVIGTSSIRRTAQIALKFPHLKVQDLRGNIDTRLRRLDEEGSQYDAIIIAAAGLIRIEQSNRINQLLSSSDGGMLYAVGQGAIGIENRIDDDRVKKIMSTINHLPTFFATSAERSLLRTIEGGCSAPLGVESDWLDDRHLRLSAIVVSVDGKEFAEAVAEEYVQSFEDAERLGQVVAADLLRAGGDKILSEIKAKKPTTPADLLEV